MICLTRKQLTVAMIGQCTTEDFSLIRKCSLSPLRVNITCKYQILACETPQASVPLCDMLQTLLGTVRHTQRPNTRRGLFDRTLSFSPVFGMSSLPSSLRFLIRFNPFLMRTSTCLTQKCLVQLANTSTYIASILCRC